MDLTRGVALARMSAGQWEHRRGRSLQPVTREEPVSSANGSDGCLSTPDGGRTAFQSEHVPSKLTAHLLV